MRAVRHTVGMTRHAIYCLLDSSSKQAHLNFDPAEHLQMENPDSGVECEGDSEIHMKSTTCAECNIQFVNPFPEDNGKVCVVVYCGRYFIRCESCLRVFHFTCCIVQEEELLNSEAKFLKRAMEGYQCRICRQ